MALHDPIHRIGAFERMVASPDMGHVISADATRDVRRTVAQFDADSAAVEAHMARRFGPDGVSAARQMANVLGRMLVRR